MIAPVDSIAQILVEDSANDSADLFATPSASSIVLVPVTLYLPGGVGRTVNVTVGGVTATKVADDPIVSSLGVSTYLFHARGAFSSPTVEINIPGADPYYIWAAEEWSGLKLQDPSEQGRGTETTSGTNCSVSTSTLTVPNSLVVGYAVNGETQSPSQWSAPTDYTFGPLDVQNWAAASSGCMFRRVTAATTAQVLAMTGATNRNYGRVAFAVFDGLDAPAAQNTFFGRF